MIQIYDELGLGYSRHRAPDPRIHSRIQAHLVECTSVVNVGAGTGSYEPTGAHVVAVEPAREMIRQRRSSNAVVQAKAESLPFPDGSFDAAMAVLTIHHWIDRPRGLAECLRVVRDRVVVLTWDPASSGVWLVQDYFPELLAIDRGIFPSMDELRVVMGDITVEPVLVPHDCVDGFMGAYWRRPEAYLDPNVRSAISSFARASHVEERLARLRVDLASGAWDARHGALRSLHELDVGYRLVVAKLARR